MHNCLLEIITVSSILISILFEVGFTSETDRSHCTYILRRECSLRWSEDVLNFVTSPPSTKDGDASLSEGSSSSPILSENKIAETGGSGDNMICIRAPKDYHIEVNLSLGPLEENDIDFRDNCHSNSECKVSCLAIHDQGYDRLSVQEVNSPTVVPSKINLPTADLQNTTHANSSESGDNIERFPRHSLVTIRNGTRIPSPNNSSVIVSRKKHRSHKCKNCKRKSNRRRRKHRAHKEKLDLFKLLLEYHKLLMASEARNHSKSKIGLPFDTALLKSTSALRNVRERIDRYVASGKRIYHPYVRGYNNTRPTISKAILTSPTNIPEDLRTKQSRQKRETPTNETEIGGNLSSQPALSGNFPRLELCGLEALWNTSKGKNRGYFVSKERYDNSTLLRATRHKMLVENITAYEDAPAPDNNGLLSLESPLSFTSTGEGLNLDILRELGGDNTLLRFLVVKILFVPNERRHSAGDTMLFTNVEEQPTASHDATTGHVDASSDQEYLRNTSNLENTHSLSHEEDGENIKIVIGVVSGVLLVSAVACLYMFTMHRHQVARQLRKRCACISNVENPKTHRNSKKRRRGRHDEGQQHMSQESEIKMLEHEKHKRSPASRKNSANRKHTNNQHTSPKCKHFNVTNGSSRHADCIVCQIAEKPHQPFNTAQHATEFLSPASRQHNIGCGGTLPNSQNNFDKYNRMKNNPYRYSPSLPVRHAALPSTVNLPDGEEIYKGQEQKPLMSGDDTSGNGRETNYIRPPPNRTIFESEALPFSSSSLHQKVRKENGYPGPPSSGSKHNSRHHDNSRVHLINCIEERPLHKEDCICKYKYILNHIGEPPPEYTEKEETPLQNTQINNNNNNIITEAVCNSTPVKKDSDISSNAQHDECNSKQPFLDKHERSKNIDKAKSRDT